MLSVAILTPPGRGAVATVAVWGSGATAIVSNAFAPVSGCVFQAAAMGQIRFGRWRTSGEEVVVALRDQDEVEVHCHGGQAAVAAIVASLIEHGCRQVPWADWIRRHTPRSIAAEAVEAMAQATTLRAAAILLDQYHGALDGEVKSCTALIEAGDRASLEQAGNRLRQLRERWHVGRHLVEPFRVVVAGKPNVGKSSLINALAGFERSIVYDQPGTTRDVVTVRTAVGGWAVELSDTAGLRDSSDVLEAAGVRMSLDRMAAADLVVLVFDASHPWQQTDEEVAARRANAIVVHNKVDLAPPAAKAKVGIATSAVRGTGIKELLLVIEERLVPDPPPSGAAVPFLSSHEQAIREALDYLDAGDRGAAACLRKMNTELHDNCMA